MDLSPGDPGVAEERPRAEEARWRGWRMGGGGGGDERKMREAREN